MPKTTKKQIITTAKELFSVYNYDSVSMNDIAQKLNISKPALYHHFANKGEIYLGAVQDVYGYFIKNFEKIIKKNIKTKEKLKKILSLFLELKLCKNKKNECHNMIIMQKLSKHDENATIFLKKAKNQLYKTLSPLFDEIIEKNNNLKNIKKLETIIIDMNNDDAFIETIGAIKPETQIDVTANIGGSVKNIYFNLGDDVYVNKLLASLYDGAVLTGLNNAQTNYANMQSNLSSTEILGNEAIRQAEIGVQSAEETIKSAEIALNSAQDNLANIKTLKDKNKIDVKTNPIISFNSFLNSIFKALNQINQILEAEDGTGQITGIEYVLGVKKLSTVHIAETSYRAAKNQYYILTKTTPNTEDIKEKMLDMINCLFLFFLNNAATPEINTLPLPDALPI